MENKITPIRVLIKKPGSSPEIKMINNGLRSFQKIVEGYIETVDLDQDVVLICNEDGKCIGLPYNFDLTWDDYIVGTALFASANDEGYFIGLSDEQIQYVERFLKGGIKECKSN